MQKVSGNEKSCSKYEKLPKKVAKQLEESPNWGERKRKRAGHEWGWIEVEPKIAFPLLPSDWLACVRRTKAVARNREREKSEEKGKRREVESRRGRRKFVLKGSFRPFCQLVIRPFGFGGFLAFDQTWFGDWISSRTQVPERPISAYPGLKCCSTFCIYLPMHCLE